MLGVHRLPPIGYGPDYKERKATKEFGDNYLGGYGPNP